MGRHKSVLKAPKSAMRFHGSLMTAPWQLHDSPIVVPCPTFGNAMTVPRQLSWQLTALPCHCREGIIEVDTPMGRPWKSQILFVHCARPFSPCNALRTTLGSRSTFLTRQSRQLIRSYRRNGGGYCKHRCPRSCGWLDIIYTYI